MLDRETGDELGSDIIPPVKGSSRPGAADEELRLDR